MYSLQKLSLWISFANTLVLSQSNVAPPPNLTQAPKPQPTTSHLGPPPTSSHLGPPPTAGVTPKPVPAAVVINDTTINPLSSRYRTSAHGGRRVRVHDADFYCLEGFELNPVSQRCESVDDREPSMGCPTGWNYQTNTCATTSVRPADRYCAEGFRDVLGRCQRRLEAPRQLKCPPAYNHTEFGCVKDVETAPIYECEKGDMINGACMKLMQTKPLALCDTGFENFGDRCARKRLLQYEEICPAGFHQHDNKCVQTTKAQPKLMCPEGNLSFDGICSREVVVPPFYQCADERIEDANALCAHEVTAPSKEACPPGAEMVGDLCILDEVIEPLFECPKGTQQTSLGCASGKSIVPMSKGCPHGFALRDKANCYKRSTMDTERVCEVGFSLRGNLCVATEYITPQLACPEGALPTNGRCLHVEHFEATPTCEEGMMYDKMEQACIGEAFVPVTKDCDVGTYESAENACVLAEVFPAKVMCPPGSKILGSSKGMPNLCEELIETPPVVKCPPDFELGGMQAGVCYGRALTEGELTCMEPYVEIDGVCVFDEIIPKIIGCADGGYLKGTSCVSQRTQPAVVMCQDGYQFRAEKGMCSKMLWSKPVPICKPGYQYDNLVQKCYKFESPQEIPAIPAQEASLPLQVAPMGTTTTTTTIPVKARVQQPAAGKEQFIPMATFTGPDAVRQAGNLEALKLMNGAQPVYVPPVLSH